MDKSNIFVILAVIVFAAISLSGWYFPLASAQTDNLATIEGRQLAFMEGNSLLSFSDPTGPEPKVAQTLPVVVTAYSSTPWETDDDPFTTAAGTAVRNGIIANNLFPFGTKVRIPEVYGDKVFVVEDRMSWKKSNYHFDIWFPSYSEAKNFGVRETYVEILES